MAVVSEDEFHIPVGTNRDPDDMAFVKHFPANYDEPGARFYEIEGTAMLEGSPNGTGVGEKLHQLSIVGPDRSLSTYVFEYVPDIPIRLHFHDVDQIGLVTRGEALMGNRRLCVGEGAFMPAGNAYAFTPGHLGVTMIELRKRAPFRWGFPNQDTDIKGWVRRREFKAKFFDIDTAAPKAIGAVLTRNGPVEVDGTVRTLLEPYGNDWMSLYAITLGPGARIPAHAEDVERSLHVRSGTLRVGDADLRYGGGVRWPAGAPLELEAGPAGATYIVHRASQSWSKSSDDEAWVRPASNDPGSLAF